jgi:hypothetical protein
LFDPIAFTENDDIVVDGVLPVKRLITPNLDKLLALLFVACCPHHFIGHHDGVFAYGILNESRFEAKGLFMRIVEAQFVTDRIDAVVFLEPANCCCGTIEAFDVICFDHFESNVSEITNFE